MNNYSKLYDLILEVIVPLSQHKDHPLGPISLHRHLVNYKSVFDRDKEWSGPGYGNDHSSKMDGLTEIQINRKGLIKRLRLSQKLGAKDLPLVVSWFLSSLDSVFRHDAKISLTQWGAICNPNELIELVDIMFAECNDVQVLEDLTDVLLGVARLDAFKRTENLTIYSDWIINKFFDNQKEPIYENVVIRSNTKQILDLTAQINRNNELSKYKLIRSSPEKSLLDLDLDFLKQKIGVETFPIGHDLAWYVIEKAFADFLITDDKGQKKLDTFYDEYAKYYDKKIGQLEIIYSATVYKMKKNGWRSEPGQNYFTQASHGSKSKLLTEIEKLIWCSVHEIYAFLSDKLPKINDGKRVNDYREKFSNYDPSEYVPNSIFFDCPIINKEFLPYYDFSIEEDFPRGFLELKAVAKVWVDKTLLINWQNLLFPNKRDLEKAGIQLNSAESFLLSHVSISDVDKTKSVRQQLNASAFLIDNLLLDAIISSPNFFQDWISKNIDHIYSHSASIYKWTYLSPREIYNIDLNEFHDLEIPISIDDVNSELVPLNLSFISNNIIDGDINHIIPSPKIYREYNFNISSDGETTFNNLGELMALKVTKRKNYDVRQEFLCQNSKILTNSNNAKSIIWLAEVVKQTITHVDFRIDLKDLNLINRDFYMIYISEYGKLIQLYLGRKQGHG